MNAVTSKIPVDMVFTYVDGNDPGYVAIRSRYRSELPDATQSKNVSDSGDIDIRFRNVGEITFSVNSVLKYLPWIRKIFIVTETPRLPVSLHLLNSGRIRIVDHQEFIPSQYLPTFSSNVIESFLHRIDGLSEIFLYNNDDYMHFSPIRPDFFYTTSGEGKISLELHVYPAVYRWIMTGLSYIFRGYRTNLHTIGISNAYSFLRKCRHHLACRDIVVPVHATKIWRKATALQVEQEFGSILDETRRRRFRDARDLSYYTILYSMENKWNPQNRVHLHLWGSLFAPNTMFDFTAFSVFGNSNLLWKRIAGSHAPLVCLNNMPLSERRRFEEVMREKGLAETATDSVPIRSKGK
jgi:hypothetical protein